jgi:hypothetical protein
LAAGLNSFILSALENGTHDDTIDTLFHKLFTRGYIKKKVNNGAEGVMVHNNEFDDGSDLP